MAPVLEAKADLDVPDKKNKGAKLVVKPLAKVPPAVASKAQAGVQAEVSSQPSTLAEPATE